MKLFSHSLFDELAAKATASARQRANHNVHAASSDPVQRFFVAANQGTYFRPHRHLSKSELALVLRGRFDVITFDDRGAAHGALLDRRRDRRTLVSRLPAAPGTRLISHADGSLFFEVKEGPYDPATTSEFAPWSPPEGHAAVAAFLQWTRTATPGATAPAF